MWANKTLRLPDMVQHGDAQVQAAQVMQPDCCKRDTPREP